jgi:hypothetical protein
MLDYERYRHGTNARSRPTLECDSTKFGLQRHPLNLSTKRAPTVVVGRRSTVEYTHIAKHDHRLRYLGGEGNRRRESLLVQVNKEQSHHFKGLPTISKSLLNNEADHQLASH